jgi:hypothetical protein
MIDFILGYFFLHTLHIFTFHLKSLLNSKDLAGQMLLGFC